MIQEHLKKLNLGMQLQRAWDSKMRFPTGIFAMLALLLQGCVAVNTFPMMARPGDTVSVMVGGSELARKETISATLQDANGIEWNLNELGLIRSVFNLRLDGRAYGLHYSDYFDIETAWMKGHEPLQTVMVIDVPESAAIGAATIAINLNATDDSSGITQPFSITLDIVDIPAKSGASDQFLRQHFNGINRAVILNDLEPAPHAKISFGISGFSGFSAVPSDTILGAALLVVDFDEGIINGDDLTVYVAESTQRSSSLATSPFGRNTQRTVLWEHNGSQLFIWITTPMGIKDTYLQAYVIHPRGLTGNPALSLFSATGFDIDGKEIPITPRFTYHP